MFYRFFLQKALPVFFILFSCSIYGKEFKTPYVSFDVEYPWTCKSFGVHWVCYHKMGKKSPPALILTTAKMGGQSNHLDFYIQNFKKDAETGRRASHIKKVTVNQHIWVESFYQNSVSKDIRGRFIATVCCDKMPNSFHVLVGFHAHKKNYARYASEFLKSIRSLKLSKDFEKIKELIGRQTNRQTQDMQGYLQDLLWESEESKVMKTGNYLFMFVLLILFFAVFFVFYFFKKKKVKRKINKRKRSKK